MSAFSRLVRGLRVLCDGQAACLRRPSYFSCNVYGSWPSRSQAHGPRIPFTPWHGGFKPTGIYCFPPTRIITDSERLISDNYLSIFAAGDGSFVETSSGAAARELKKRYDEKLGVGSPAKGSYAISPYAITAFVNQHGKQMYRVG